MDVHSELFEAFTPDGMLRQLAWLDMPADEIPAVGVRPTQWMAMHQEHETVAHECSD